MGFNSLNQIEERFKRVNSDRNIAFNLRVKGIDCIISRTVAVKSASIKNPDDKALELSQSAFDVFGDYSGIAPNIPKTEVFSTEDEKKESSYSFSARVVIAKIPLNPIDAANSGALEQHIVYTTADLHPNDRLTIHKTDGTDQHGIIGQKLTWGLTSSVYSQYELNNFGDGVA